MNVNNFTCDEFGAVGGPQDVATYITGWDQVSSGNSKVIRSSGNMGRREYEPTVAKEGPVGAYSDARTGQVIGRIHVPMPGPNSDVEDVTENNSALGLESLDKEQFQVARSRRSFKTAVNPSRRHSVGTSKREGFRSRRSSKERYTYMPGLADSQYHVESFTQEESNNIFIILLAIIVFCVVGISCGVLIPRLCVHCCDKKLAQPRPSALSGGDVF